MSAINRLNCCFSYSRIWQPERLSLIQSSWNLLSTLAMIESDPYITYSAISGLSWAWCSSLGDGDGVSLCKISTLLCTVCAWISNDSFAIYAKSAVHRALVSAPSQREYVDLWWWSSFATIQNQRQPNRAVNFEKNAHTESPKSKLGPPCESRFG